MEQRELFALSQVSILFLTLQLFLYAPLTPAALGGAANINALNTQLYGPLDAIFTAYGEPNRINPLSSTSANPILITDGCQIEVHKLPPL